MYCIVCGYGGVTKEQCPRCGATGNKLIAIPAMAQGPMYKADTYDLEQDETGFTKPNLHRRASLESKGIDIHIDYPTSKETQIYDYTFADDVMTKYIGKEQDIRIPDICNLFGITTIGIDAFVDTEVHYVEIPDGITTIE